MAAAQDAPALVGAGPRTWSARCYAAACVHASLLLGCLRRGDSGDGGGDNTEQMELRAGELGLSPRSNVYHYSGFLHPSHIPIRLHFFFFFSLWIMEHCISALLKRYTALYSYNT